MQSWLSSLGVYKNHNVIPTMSTCEPTLPTASAHPAPGHSVDGRSPFTPAAALLETFSSLCRSYRFQSAWPPWCLCPTLGGRERERYQCPQCNNTRRTSASSVMMPTYVHSWKLNRWSKPCLLLRKTQLCTVLTLCLWCHHMPLCTLKNGYMNGISTLFFKVTSGYYSSKLLDNSVLPVLRCFFLTYHGTGCWRLLVLSKLHARSSVDKTLWNSQPWLLW